MMSLLLTFHPYGQFENVSSIPDMMTHGSISADTGILFGQRAAYITGNVIASCGNPLLCAPGQKVATYTLKGQLIKMPVGPFRGGSRGQQAHEVRWGTLSAAAALALLTVRPRRPRRVLAQLQRSDAAVLDLGRAGASSGRPLQVDAPRTGRAGVSSTCMWSPKAREPGPPRFRAKCLGSLVVRVDVAQLLCWNGLDPMLSTPLLRLLALDGVYFRELSAHIPG
ncbi:hypothetical protein TREES_T100011927 [Tupaia chinensis]|uniref:Uncharacterized protein n=1 Tax=Tupaia chinensis TaxID=246437 RepID=L9KU17_TUPCH|nr:hypothetical protein TREES_T100011927 [Tupaia chinensis]